MKYILQAVGADPELFLFNLNTGEPVPCVQLLPGTKQQPSPIKELGDGFAVQEDNVMAEFNIPPCKTAEEFDNSIDSVLKYLESYFVKQQFGLDISATQLFKPHQLKSDQAQMMGCDPDYDAWNRRKNPSPDTKFIAEGLRSAGGHIHVSFNRDDGEDISLKDRELVVRAMDYHLGLPSLFLDKDEKRRFLYGNPGAFRPKEYGIEYRTLSNFWIKTPELRKWVFNATKKALKTASEYPDFLLYADNHYWPTKIFKENALNLAKEAMNILKVSMPVFELKTERKL